MKILAAIGSPRKKSNSTLLLNEFIAGAIAEGAEAEVITPFKMNIGPCIACEGCYKTGLCVVKDDYQEIYDKIMEVDALVISTPIYFGAVSAQIKAFIDRFQCFWAMRDMVKAEMPPGPAGGQRKGVLIAVAGIDKPVMFQGAKITFDFIMRSMQGVVWAELLYRGYDDREEIRRTPAALERARELGRRLALGLDAD